MSFKKFKKVIHQAETRVMVMGLLVVSSIQIEIAKASGFEQCDGINQNRYQIEYQGCLRSEIVANSDVDCVECLFAAQEKSNPWLEALGLVAAPVAAIAGSYFNYKGVKSMAEAQESGYSACTSQFNSALDYNISSGATAYTGSELSGLMGSCNGSSLSAYSGYNGVVNNGFGSYANPYLSGGYSSAFMSGMTGPYSNLTNGLSLNAGLNLSGGINLSGLGSNYALSGMYNNGIGVNYALNGMYNNGIGANYALNGMYNNGVGANYSLNGALGGNLSLNNGLTSMYSGIPYTGLGGSVNLGLNVGGNWGSTASYNPNMTGVYGLPSSVLGGSGMINANMGLNTAYSNNLYANNIYGNNLYNNSATGSYFNNTGANNQYWQQQQQTYANAQAGNSIVNQINASNYATAAGASSSLYNNYVQAGSALQNSYSVNPSSAFYGATPYAAGNLSANFSLGGNAIFGY